MKATVGICRKIGQPDYGSIGATCHVEFDLVQELIQDDPESFHQHVRDAFAACSDAVHEELARQRGSSATETPASPKPASNGNGAPHRNGQQHAIPAAGRASDKQLVYLRQLARLVPAVGLRRLDELAQNVCGKTTVVLSTAEASRLIDSLKAVKAGELDLQEILPGAPT
jgi:Tfp pilus assembly protein PilW